MFVGRGSIYYPQGEGNLINLIVGALLAAPFPRNHTRLPFTFTPIAREAIMKKVI